MTKRVCPGDSRHVSGGRDSLGEGRFRGPACRRILAHRAWMSAGGYVELMCVLARSQDPAATRRADRLPQTLGIEVIPVSVEQSRLAGEAYRVYGRGSGHQQG